MHEGRIRGLLQRLKNLSRKEDAIVADRVATEAEIAELRGLRDRSTANHDLAKYTELEKELVDEQARRVREVLTRPTPGRDYREQQQALLREQAARPVIPPASVVGTDAGSAVPTVEAPPPTDKSPNGKKKKAREE